jgi:hypothetical protein
VAFLAEARRLLGAEHARLLARVESARQIRNRIQYQARDVTQPEAIDLEHAATELLAVAREYVERCCR